LSARSRRPLLPVPAIIATIGWIVLLIGIALLILGQVGRPVGGRRYWYWLPTLNGADVAEFTLLPQPESARDLRRQRRVEDGLQGHRSLSRSCAHSSQRRWAHSTNKPVITAAVEVAIMNVIVDKDCVTDVRCLRS
jgi:hypothetical protein